MRLARARLRASTKRSPRLTVARRIEGKALAALLTERLNAIAALVEAADANPARRPEAVRERLAQSVRR